MQIELNNSLASLLRTDQSVKQVSTSDTAATQGATGATQDRTTFHSDSLSVQSLTSQALSSPEIRQGKVETLNPSIAGHTRSMRTELLAP
jgi:anti-sigma28 factor (negative regulator of flagellin synthesis)